MSKPRFFLLVLLALFSIPVRLASAQVTTATILGAVTDETGSVLPGTTVTVESMETGITRNAITDDAGRYRVSNLNVGTYKVTVGLAGFQTTVRSGVTLTIGKEAIVDVTLKVGEVTEQVTVAGEAPLVEVTSSSLGEIVDHKTVIELPLNGRDLTDLLTLQSGTANVTTASSGTSSGFSQQVSISGARPHDNAVLLDGTEVKSTDAGVPAGMSGSFLGAEAIQEFKVERNAYSAEFGGNAGGVINVVSKAGTNDFHGSVYEFLRNDNLDASNFREAPKLDASGKFVGKLKPEFKRNQFGFSFGGPVIKNKTFFFGNYEGLRERLGVTSFLRTLTQQARQGSLQDPRTGQFRTVPVNPGVVPYLNLWPLPGAGAEDLRDGTAIQPTSFSQPTNEDFYQIRIDHQFSDADSFFARLTRATSERSSPLVISRWVSEDRIYNTFVTVEEKKILSPQLLNTFRLGFNRRGGALNSFEASPTDAVLHFVPAPLWRAPLGAKQVLGRLDVTGLSPIGIERGWANRVVNRFQYSDDLVYNRGGHSLKFGMGWQRLQLNGDNPNAPAGWWTFNSVEGLLRAQPSRFRGDILPESDSVRGIRWNVVGWYIQDDFRLNSKLTVNLGFRYEFFTVPTEVQGKISNLRNPQVDTAPALGDPWFKNPSRKDFMPRVGLAWDPTGSGKNAVRVGFGVFYNHIEAETFRQAAFRNAPFGLDTNIQGVGSIPFPVIYDFVVRSGGARVADMHLFPFDYARDPHMLQWNFNVQREVLPQTAVTLGYAGSRGLNLLTQVSLNTAKAEVINGRYVFPANARVPNPFWGLALTSREGSADSSYHSLQLALRRRFQAGWQTQLSYTYSRTIDESSQLNPTFGNEGGGKTYYWDPDMHRSLAAFHVSQVFAASGVWQLPFGSGRRFGANWAGWTEQVFGGWQLGGILSLTTGPPVTIGIGTRNDLSVLNLGGETPDVLPGASNNPKLGGPDKYFDPLVFVLPPPRTIGNVGRNTLIGPGVANFDLSLIKKAQLSERASLEFRTEFFNLLNHANLATPATQVFDATGRSSGGAGLISRTTTTSRQLQFALRMVF